MHAAPNPRSVRTRRGRPVSWWRRGRSQGGRGGRRLAAGSRHRSASPRVARRRRGRAALALPAAGRRGPRGGRRCAADRCGRASMAWSIAATSVAWLRAGCLPRLPHLKFPQALSFAPAGRRLRRWSAAALAGASRGCVPAVPDGDRRPAARARRLLNALASPTPHRLGLWTAGAGRAPVVGSSLSTLRLVLFLTQSRAGGRRAVARFLARP
jgi:hypothetical protein